MPGSSLSSSAVHDTAPERGSPDVPTDCPPAAALRCEGATPAIASEAQQLSHPSEKAPGAGVAPRESTSRDAGGPPLARHASFLPVNPGGGDAHAPRRALANGAVEPTSTSPKALRQAKVEGPIGAGTHGVEAPPERRYTRCFVAGDDGEDVGVPRTLGRRPAPEGDEFDIFDDEDSASAADDANSMDSYGIPKYVPRYPPEASRIRDPHEQDYHHADDLSVPWHLRSTRRGVQRCSFFDFLQQPQFWVLFIFATRITAIAVLVPSALIAARLPHSPFVSPFMVISSTVLAAKGNVGESVAYLFVWIRAGCLWLPLAVIGGALSLGGHIAGWCVYYTAILFLMAVITEGMPRRICLLLFNSCLVGLLVDPRRGSLYACRVMADWSIGTGLCLVAAFVPYPIFCKNEAQRLLSDIAKNTGTAFRGLVYSFWGPTNVERNMAMSKVRVMTESLDVLLPAFEHSQNFSFYEFLFESAEVREIRVLKFHLFERLRVNLSSMTRVLDMVEAAPSAVDNSERSQAFCRLLSPHLNSVAQVFDEFMDLLASAKTKKAILALNVYADALRQRTDELQDAYRLARRMLFYEYTSDTLEEFVPLMTFYLFTVVCFRDTIDMFEMKVKDFKTDFRVTLRDLLRKAAYNPFMENIHFVQILLKRFRRSDVQRVIEAAKVSAAMILTIGFSYLIRVERSSFSGPNIIAFVSGMNPVEAVQASIVRLTGCLIGTVLGFFAGTYSDTPVRRVASLCTLMFIGTFLRTDKEYGIMSVYAMFVLIPLDSILETTIEDTVSRMNQNTFGIFIYLFVSIIVFPLSPSSILRKKRANVLRRMRATVSNMMWLFSIPLVGDMGSRTFSFENLKSFGLTAHPPRDVAAADVAASACGHGVKLPRDAEESGMLTNRSFHMVMHTDTAMEELSSQLDDIIRRLKDTKEFMGFAKDERGLVTIDYPVKACNATYQHMYRMAFLLKTMWLSWNVIRSQHSYTEETKHMMRNLQPVARDVASAFGRIVDLMTYMMRDPSVNLEGDVMKANLDLLAAATELHTRKSQIMLMLINKSVEQYREDAAFLNDRRDGASTVSLSGTTARGEPERPRGEDTVFPSSSAKAKTDQQQQQQQSLPGRRQRRSDGHSFDMTFSTGTPAGRELMPQSATARHGPAFSGPTSHLPRAATFDGASLAFGKGTYSPGTSPTTQWSGQNNFRTVASERNVSVLPYLNRAARHSAESADGPVRLPVDFRFPVTSEDAEGMHSFTLCLEMFAEETKQLMMSLDVMLDHLRSKV